MIPGPARKEDRVYSDVICEDINGHGNENENANQNVNVNVKTFIPFEYLYIYIVGILSRMYRIWIEVSL